ncbi:DUF2076 domain-containing protein [Pseudomonas sp. R5(2019)]|uniref:DUF2076 domain-containing protein n=1 Tax=Pseudomonas sp. R5(2019) TaxID=2697566 RepID=UPI00141358C7|nr:DUF2076 domain-containing protein [Pseudomonas sp. R5(2019)]NBA98118.1 DUF2076 family protein [Pseudomonas sp. R5(2019)]
MNSEEQTLIDGLFARLKQAETPSTPRDAQAEQRIVEHLHAQPSAPYYMAQAILVQEAALKRLDEQNKQLQAELAQAKAQAHAAPAQAPAASGGGFLSSLFGGSSRAPQSAPQPVQRQAPVASSGGGWREPSSHFGGAPGMVPQQNYAAPQPQAAPARAGSSFLGGALQTAAGVAGGVMLAQGISSLFNQPSQPEEVAEVAKEEPAPASDTGGWGNDQPQMVSHDNNGGDQGGFMDAGYSDDGGDLFSDDEYV